jgi:hypothetical protein
MTVTEIKQALGSWEIRLLETTPQEILNRLTYFGHIAIITNRVNPAEYGDELLDAARYVGVYRSRSSFDQYLIRGSGMAFWLGDEDDKGDVFETPVTLTAASFAAAVTALLPPGGAVTAGTLSALVGTYTGTHQWQTPRSALNYVTETFGGEYRVNNNATLDAGTVSDLYVTDPRAIIMRKAQGADLRVKALPGRMELGQDAEDYTTRVVLLAEGEGDAISTGEADGPATPFNDLHGNDVVMTRLISESDTSEANADARASILLNHFAGERQTINLSTDVYDINGDVRVGDYVNVFDPPSGFVDETREVYWEGQPINPVSIRVAEISWPIPAGWTVAFRRTDGEWIDLSAYYAPETGQTTLTVGDLSRSLATSEPIGIRPSLPTSPTLDTSIPDAPAFLSFNPGSYQSDEISTTKAAFHVTWSLPLNTDLSTITDGAYYELRYRISGVLGYKVKWGVAAGFKWGQLEGNPWAFPLSDPIDTDREWNYLQVGWGTNEATIAELTPGITYEFQIRAVDAAVPPHFGPWSASSFETTVGDLFAPSTPAAPSVAGNPMSIQVTHTLGQASGGTFNLEPDIVRLLVHVGGSTGFYPDDTNQVGELAANAGMLLQSIPAVGTFQITPVEQIYVKVVAVDRAGNKSQPSAGATVTAELIDDQYISSLTVSKLTAGTITAESVLAARMGVSGSGGFTVSGGGDITVLDGGNITIQEGSLDVLDNLGVTQVEMGLLSDGTYGLAAVNALGQLVPLSRLAFGVKSETVAASEATTNTSNFTDLATYGPHIPNVEVGSLGRMLVIVSCKINIGGSGTIWGSGGYMSFDVINQATGVIQESASQPNGAGTWIINISSTYQSEYTVSRTVLLGTNTPIPAGIYTVVAKYLSFGVSSPGTNHAEFGRRNLTVLPY